MCDGVLIINEVPEICEFVGAVLRREGFSIVSAVTGEQGLARLSEKSFHLVLLDAQLPDCDGMVLLGEIRAQHPQLPIIITTRHGTIEEAIKVSRGGATDYVTDPWLDDRLLSSVRKAIDKPPVPKNENTIPHAECIESLQHHLWGTHDSTHCPVCGRDVVEREKSALELWEDLLSAGSDQEKHWRRRVGGRVIQLANYLLIIGTAVAFVFLASYFVYCEFWILIHTAVWWLSALGVLMLVRLVQSLRARTRT